MASKRMRKLLNSEVDKYAKDRELFFSTFRESRAPEILRLFMNGELPQQFIPTLDLTKRKGETQGSYEKRVQEAKNELEIWKAKMRYKAFTYVIDKMIQLFPKVPEQSVSKKHSVTLRSIVKDTYDKYIPKDSSQEILEVIEKKVVEQEFSSNEEGFIEVIDEGDKDIDE